MRGRQVRAELEGLTKVRDRAGLSPSLSLASPRLFQEKASTVVLQRLVVVRKPALVVALVEAGRAAVALAAGILGRDPDHLAIVGGSAVELIGIAVGIAAVDIGEHVRLEPNLHAVVGNRMPRVAHAVEDITAVAIGDGERRIELDRRIEVAPGTSPLLNRASLRLL